MSNYPEGGVGGDGVVTGTVANNTVEGVAYQHDDGLYTGSAILEYNGNNLSITGNTVILGNTNTSLSPYTNSNPYKPNGQSASTGGAFTDGIDAGIPGSGEIQNGISVTNNTIIGDGSTGDPSLANTGITFEDGTGTEVVSGNTVTGFDVPIATYSGGAGTSPPTGGDASLTSSGTSSSGGGGGGTTTTSGASPTITGTKAGQTTTSEGAISPFASVTLADANSNATDTLLIALGGAGGTLSGTGLTNNGGIYTLSGSAATVTSELQALSFAPTAGSANTSSTTSFSLIDTSSGSSGSVIDGTTSVIDQDPAVAPTLSGTTAGQTTTSEASIKPFSAVSIADRNSGASETLTITIGGTGGSLSGSGLSGSGSVYTLSGSVATVTSEVEALSFTPSAGAPNTSSTSSFTLSLLSSAFATATTDATTTVVDGDPAVAPTITGTKAGQTTSAEAAVTPFSAVTLGDANANGSDALTITLSGGGGTLADGAGFGGLTATGTAGVYTLASGSAASVASELRALVFTPAATGSVSTTTFTLVDKSSAGLSATDGITTLVDTPAASVSGSTGQGSTGTGSGGQGTTTGSGGQSVSQVAPTLTIDPTVAFSGPDHFALSGTVADPNGIASLQLYADVGGQTQALGTADVAADGSWSFSDSVGRAPQTFIYGVATDTLGNQTTVGAGLDLEIASPGSPYRAVASYFDGTGNFQGQSFFEWNGNILYSDTYAPGADGGSVFSYSGGSYFNGKAEKGFVETYSPSGNLESETIDERDGTHETTAYAAGQTLTAQGADVMNANGYRDTSFAFTSNGDQATVLGFQASGGHHDTILLPATGFTNIAQILHDTHNQNGSAVITDPYLGDTITVQGVSKAELKAHPGDFKFL